MLATRYMATHPFTGGAAMTIRRSLPLSLMLMFGGCGYGRGDSADDGVTAATATLHGGDGAGDDDARLRNVRHVLLISVDGMHQVDAGRFIAAHPDSTLPAPAGSRFVL